MKQASTVCLLGNLLRLPAVAGLVVFGCGLVSVLVSALPARAQLPPVNMGKFVHQPGDNQYSNGTQTERHGGGGGGGGGYQVVNPAPQQMQGPAGWVPTHKNRPDISIEPIVCDEPIAKAGFPPVPDSLDLPGVRGGGNFGAPLARIGGYAGSAPGMAGAAPAPPEAHQGYQTYQPGAFHKGKTTGKGAEMYSSGDGAAAPRGGFGTVEASPAQRQLSHMGKEPSLSDKAANVAPEAPQAMQVNQSTTQDLSLPDDQASGGRKSQSQAGRMAKQMARQTLYRGASMIYAVPIRMP